MPKLSGTELTQAAMDSGACSYLPKPASSVSLRTPCCSSLSQSLTETGIDFYVEKASGTQETSEPPITLESLRVLAMELHQEGVSLMEIYHYLDTFRQYLGRHGRIAEEQILGDSLNRLLGFCAPDQLWFEDSLTHDEIEAYQNAHETRVILSGCSGSGKSTLLAELQQRGYTAFPEPGRLVVQEQLATGGDGLPWEDSVKFMELCAQASIEFYDAATKIEGPVFFDRSPFDHFIGLSRLDIPVPAIVEAAVTHCRYHRLVFLVPPWEEIYVTDAERKHSFEEAVAEYEGLLRGYQNHQFHVVVLPRTTVAERADLVERELQLS